MSISSQIVQNWCIWWNTMQLWKKNEVTLSTEMEYDVLLKQKSKSQNIICYNKYDIILLIVFYPTCPWRCIRIFVDREKWAYVILKSWQKLSEKKVRVNNWAEPLMQI